MLEHVGDWLKCGGPHLVGGESPAAVNAATDWTDARI